MNKPENYTEYLISAVDDNQAADFAAENKIEDSNLWFRLPSTLEDTAELFKKETTSVLSREEWKNLSEEEYEDRSLRGQAKSRILFAKDLNAAAKYASARNWWLHSWKFVADAELEEVIEYAFYC